MPKSVFKLCKDVFVLTTALIQDIDVCHNIHFTNSIDDVIKYFTFIDDPVYVIGGQCIYKCLEKYIDTWYITHVNYEPKKQADTFFDVDLSQHKFMSVLQTGDGWEIVKHYK